MEREFKVIVPFTDLQDNNHVYQANKPYPREGAPYSETRALQLASKDNLRGKPLIVEVVKPQEPENEETFPKHTGGGWYELSNGEKVQGKDDAEAAESNLQ